MPPTGRSAMKTSAWPCLERFLTDDCRWDRPSARQRSAPKPTRSSTATGCLAYIRRAGPQSVGALIVSMTRSLSDLLLVHALARIAGLETIVLDGSCCPLPVVPLFETIDDLAAAPGIMDRYLANPLVQRGIHPRSQKMTAPPAGHAWLFSDSNKDGGFLASQWFLHQAQKELVAVANARPPIWSSSTVVVAPSAAAPAQPTASSKPCRMARWPVISA